MPSTNEDNVSYRSLGMMTLFGFVSGVLCVLVSVSVIPDCWALRPFTDQYCGKYFVADENFFDEIVLRYFG